MPFGGGAALTVEQVAKQLLFSPTKVSRLETGHTAPPIATSAAYYAAEEAECDVLTTLPLEGRYYHSIVIHGLLQTADYARAMHEALVPPAGFGKD